MQRTNPQTVTPPFQYALCIFIVGFLACLSFLPQVPLENPGTIELIYLNPRNIRIPRYHRLSVNTGSNCPHDISPSLESYVHSILPRSMSP